MNKKILSFFVLGILVISIVSAFWPFKMTGNAVASSSYGGSYLGTMTYTPYYAKNQNFSYIDRDTGNRYVMSIISTSSSMVRLKVYDQNSSSLIGFVSEAWLPKSQWVLSNTTNPLEIYARFPSNSYSSFIIRSVTCGTGKVWDKSTAKCVAGTMSTNVSSGGGGGGGIVTNGTSSTTEDCYTKTEVDTFLRNIATRVETKLSQFEVDKRIAERLSKATTVTIVSSDTYYASSNYTCSNICGSWTRTKDDKQFSNSQKCLWVAISGGEKNEYGGQAEDIRIIDGNSCQSPISVYLTQGYKAIACFCA